MGSGQIATVAAKEAEAAAEVRAPACLEVQGGVRSSTFAEETVTEEAEEGLTFFTCLRMMIRTKKSKRRH